MGNPLLIVVALAGSAWAVQPPVTVDVRPLLGDNHSGQGWVPMLVTITNNTDGDLDLEIVLQNRDQRATGRRSVTVPRGMRPRSYIAYQYIEENWGWRFELNYGGRPMTDMRVTSSRWSNPANMVIVGVARSNSALGSMQGMQIPQGCALVSKSRYYGGDQQVKVHMMDRLNRMEPLPDHFVGYDCCDLIVLNDCPVKEFSAAEQDALLNWVHKGGAIAISPGPDPAWLQQDFIQRLARIERAEKRLVNSLKIGGRDLRSDKPITCYEMDIPGAKRKLAGNTINTLVPCGLGTVIVFAVDLSEPAVSSCEGNRGMWETLLSEIPANPNRRVLPRDRDGFETSRINEPLARLLSVSKMPPLKVVAFLVCAYIIVAGPVNFGFLRRRQWLVYLPVSLAIIATVYVVAIFVAGYVSKGVRSTIQKAAVVEMIPGTDKAYQRSYFSIFSSAPRRYNISYQPESATVVFHPSYSDWRSSSMTCRYNGNLILADHGMTMWSTEYFASEGVIEKAGQVLFERAEDGLKITNKTPHTLLSAALRRGRAWSSVGDIAPGQTVTARVPQDRNPAQSRPPDALYTDAFQEEAFKQLTGQVQVPGRDEYLIARIEKDPMPPDLGTKWVKPQQEAIYLIARPLPGGFAP